MISHKIYRYCFLQGFIHSVVVCFKSPHSVVPRSLGFLTNTTREWNLVRRTLYDVNCMYAPLLSHSHDFPSKKPTLYDLDNFPGSTVVVMEYRKPYFEQKYHFQKTLIVICSDIYYIFQPRKRHGGGEPL